MSNAFQFRYELESAIERLCALVKDLPNVLPQEIRENTSIAMIEVDGTIKQASRKLDELKDMLTSFSTIACKYADEAYATIKNKRESIEGRLSKLVELPEIKAVIPYAFKDLIDIAERLGGMDDKQFDRLCELAKAFSVKGDSK